MKNPGFELKSEEEFQSPYDEDRTEPIYAWADYWGTHVRMKNGEKILTDTLALKKLIQMTLVLVFKTKKNGT